MIRYPIVALTLCIVAAACNGGDTGWSKTSLDTRAEFRGVFFLDPNHGFIVGGNYFIDGGIIGATTDGGDTWSFRSGLVRAKSGFTLTDVVFLDRFVGIASGTNGVILRTTDRGGNWHPVRTYTGGTDHFHDLFFLDDRHGWAVGFNGIIQTKDGGRTWSWLGGRRAVTGDAVHFFDPLHGLVAGKHGRIQSTADGGWTWTQVTETGETGTADLLAMTFVGPSRGWAVGARGTILHTTDRGGSWRRQQSGTKARLTGVAFVGPHSGWILGADRSSSSSVILHTSDGGAVWTEERGVKGELLDSLFFFSDTHGWAVGERPEHGPQTLLRYRGQ